MISLTRLGSDEPFQLNPDMIVTVESTPDTVIALATGSRVVVSQTPEEVAERVRDFRAEVLGEALSRRTRRPRSSPSPASREHPHLSAVDDDE